MNDKPCFESPKSAEEIASKIASQFYPTTSLFHADLRQQIIRAILEERKVTEYYCKLTFDVQSELIKIRQLAISGNRE